MRKVLVIVAVVGALAVGTGASAGKRWVAEGPYSFPVAGGCVDAAETATCGYYFDCGEQLGCAVVDLKSPVRAVDIEVIDSSGLPVRADIWTAGLGKIASVCGRSDDPVTVNGIRQLWVHVISGTCGDSSPSAATTGIVRVRPAR